MPPHQQRRCDAIVKKQRQGYIYLLPLFFAKGRGVNGGRKLLELQLLEFFFSEHGSVAMDMSPR